MANLQRVGTAVSTKMAPSYANLFMDDLERKIISAFSLNLTCDVVILMIYLWYGHMVKLGSGYF